MLDDAWTYILKNPGPFQAALATHLWLSATALIVGTLIALPLGVALARRPRTALVIVNFAGTLRTIPSLAVLAIMLPIFGTGFVPCAIALTISAIPPILINAFTAIRQVAPEIIEAANGMGMTRLQIVRRIELPMAVPGIVAGIRTAAVQVVAGAALAAFIGGGGLGDFIIAGIATMDSARLLVGAIPVALLAIATELIFGGLQGALTRRGMTRLRA